MTAHTGKSSRFITMHILDTLRSAPGYWYLATTYTQHPDGLEAAYIQACKVRALLTANGVRSFCPIAHTHGVAIHGGLDPLDHEMWLADDQPFMDGAHGLIVCQMAGWRESKGIAHEIEVFEKAGKPIIYMPFANGRGAAAIQAEA